MHRLSEEPPFVPPSQGGKRCSRFRLVGAVLVCLIAAAPATGHPLGNDGVTHFSVLHLSPEGLEVNLVLDIAETESDILLRNEIDADHDGRDTPAEQEAWLSRKTAEFATRLHVQCDGSPLALRPADRPADASNPAARGNKIIVKTPGVAGMPTYRLLVRYAADWPTPLARKSHTLAYEDTTFPDRRGMARILLDRAGVLMRAPVEGLDLAALNAGTIPDPIRASLHRKNILLSPAARLTVEQPGRRWRLDNPPTWFIIENLGDDLCLFSLPRVIVDEPRPPFWDECQVSPFLYEQYDPSDMPAERKTTFSFHVEQSPQPASAPATQAAAAADRTETLDYRSILTDPRNDPAKQGKSQRQAARLVALLRQPWGWTILLTVTTLCFAWGAAHALMPGHAKTLVAAYLISCSGTAWHAVLLAGIVTFTHTALVVIVGLIIWFYQRTHPQIGPTVQLWLGTIAGLLVAGMGLTLLRRAVTGGHHHHHHPHGHHHEHAHPHDHSHAHTHDHPHDHGHEHHEHAQPDRVTVRVLLLLGITGGLVPCPTATIIMLLGIGANVVLGALYAVAVFSLGLALTLMAVGFLALSSRRFAARFLNEKGAGVPGAKHPSGPPGQGLPTSADWLLNRLIPALSGLAVLALGAALTTHYLHLLRTGLPLFDWLQ